MTEEEGKLPPPALRKREIPKEGTSGRGKLRKRETPEEDGQPVKDAGEHPPQTRKETGEARNRKNPDHIRMDGINLQGITRFGFLIITGFGFAIITGFGM